MWMVPVMPAVMTMGGSIVQPVELAGVVVCRIFLSFSWWLLIPILVTHLLLLHISNFIQAL